MTPLFHIDDIAESKSKGYYTPNGAFIAVKRDGQLYIYRNICPHLGTPLEWQEDQFLDPDGELIQCTSHGALFVIESGECVFGPCAGDALDPVKFTLQDDGQVVIQPA